MESDASADFIFAKPVCATFLPVIRLDTISPDSKAAVVEVEWVCLFEPDLSPSQAKLSQAKLSLRSQKNISGGLLLSFVLA